MVEPPVEVVLVTPPVDVEVEPVVEPPVEVDVEPVVEPPVDVLVEPVVPPKLELSTMISPLKPPLVLTSTLAPAPAPDPPKKPPKKPPPPKPPPKPPPPTITCWPPPPPDTAGMGGSGMAAIATRCATHHTPSASRRNSPYSQVGSRSMTRSIRLTRRLGTSRFTTRCCFT